jgi:type IV pilus assembly protein PilN
MENGRSGRRAAGDELTMRIDINLATQAYEDSRRFWTSWGTGLALLSLLTLLLVFLALTGYSRAGQDRKQIAQLRRDIAAYDQEKAQAEALLNQPQNRALRDQSRYLNALFQRKAFSWTRVFEDLERVMPAHLHVLSIQPGTTADNNLEIKLQVGGDSREQALDLVKKMESSNRFKQTRIGTEKVSDESERNGKLDRVQFEIFALYTPSGEASPVSGGMN